MKQKIITPIICAAMAMFSLSSCGSDGNGTPDDSEKTTTTSTFAKGADVSWLTEMESKNVKFYNSKGSQQDCMALLHDIGVNAVRLRVWVDPTDGWCGKNDVLAKAKRAKALGEDIMIDFHYSDSWADPSKQNIPAAWSNHSSDLNALKTDVATHTSDVLNLLKSNGIDVKWIQIGNETSSGMLWPAGKAEGQNFTAYAALNNAGYDAAKAVYPDAKCIIHLDRGQELEHFTWMFDGLKSKGAKWDVIGMSLYPTDSDWQSATDKCLSNISYLYARYNSKIMVCEIGMSWDSSNAAAMMKKMVDGCKTKAACLGIFYWEPEAYNGWNGYTLGAFDKSGKPTATLDAFKNEK